MVDEERKRKKRIVAYVIFLKTGPFVFSLFLPFLVEITAVAGMLSSVGEHRLN